MSDYEEDDYGDEDFEDDFEAISKPPTAMKPSQRSPAKSPAFKKESPSKVTIAESPKSARTPRTATAGTTAGNGDDLESYLKGMVLSDDEGDGNDVDGHGHSKSIKLETMKELQPLDGVHPAEEDLAQLQLRAKLGYAASPAKETKPLTMVSTAAGLTPSPAYAQLSQQPPSDHVANLLAMAGNSSKAKPLQKLSEEENALKVDALLRDIFPERYKESDTKEKKPKKKITKKKAPAVQQQYGLGVPRVSGYAQQADDDDEDDEDNNPLDYPSSYNSARGGAASSSSGGGGASELLGGLDNQLKLLKKELKVKDDKIARLTEHSMMMASQMDKWKGEVARLNARLKEAQTEIEMKESRLVEVMKRQKKKKAKELHASPTTSSFSENSNTSNLEGEVLRLRDREQALMDAVEELSSQNEDLILKLRESMQRELELSSKRAQLVSHTLVPRAGAHHENSNSISHLPSIHESHTHHHYSQHPSQQQHHHHHQQHQQGMLRAQTEPGMLYASANHLNDGYGGNDNLPSKPAGKKKKKA